MDYDDLHWASHCDYCDESDVFENDLKWLSVEYPLKIKKHNDGRYYGVLWENETEREEILKIADKQFAEYKNMMLSEIPKLERWDEIYFSAGRHGGFLSYMDWEYDIFPLFDIIRINADAEKMYIVGSIDYHM